MTVATIEVKDGNPVGAIQQLLRSILERGLVSAILAPQEIPSKKTVVQTLVRDPAKLDAANPLAPVFSVNSARILAKMCAVLAPQALADDTEAPDQTEAPDEPDESAEAEAGENQTQAESADQAADGPAEAPPIGVVLRACEVRAVVELVKLQQIDLAPFLIIGVDCWGAYSVPDYAAKVSAGPQDGSVTADFLKQAAAGTLPEDLRGACRICQFPVPTCADVAIQLIGEDINRQIGLQAGTDKGRALLAAMELDETPESDGRADAVAKLTEAKKALADQDLSDFLATIEELCINCRNCSAVCPICYCKQCVFDGQVFQYPLDKYLDWSGKKGVLGLPTDKLLFHLTRLSHVVTSCVACGQCEAACPNGIALGRVYQRISAAAQQALDYEAGRSLDEELPLSTFREDELAVAEN